MCLAGFRARIIPCDDWPCSADYQRIARLIPSLTNQPISASSLSRRLCLMLVSISTSLAKGNPTPEAEPELLRETGAPPRYLPEKLRILRSKSDRRSLGRSMCLHRVGLTSACRIQSSWGCHEALKLGPAQPNQVNLIGRPATGIRLLGRRCVSRSSCGRTPPLRRSMRTGAIGRSERPVARR